MTDPVLKERLEKLIHEHGTMARVAQSIGVDVSYISYMLSGKREPSDEVAERLGLRRVVRYEPIGG